MSPTFSDRLHLPSREDVRGSLAFWLISLTVLIVAAFLRWHGILSTSLWIDEQAQVYVARLPIADFLAGVRSHIAAAPLDYLGTKLALDALGPIVGVSTLAARAWPWLCGVATVLAAEATTYELTRSRRAAVWTALMVALSGFLVFYSQEARFYSLAGLMTVASIWSFARAVRLHRRRDWVLYAAVAVAGVYTYYFIAYVLLLEGLAVGVSALRRGARDGLSRAAVKRVARGLGPMGLVAVVTGLAFAPWYLFAARYQFGIDSGYPPLPALSVGRVAQLLTTLLAAVPRDGLPGPIPMSDWLLTVIVVALAAVGFVRIVQARMEAAVAMAALAVTLIPLVWVMDARSHYFLSERQFILMVPVMYVLAGAGADAILVRLATVAGRARIRTRAIARAAAPVGLAAVLVALSILPLDRVYAGTFRPREDWRTAALFAADVLCPGGRVYSNVAKDMYFGVTLYAPELAAKAVFLAVPRTKFLGDILQRTAIAPTDVIVVFTPIVWVPGRGTIETVTQTLGGLGFRYRDFTAGRVRVLYNPLGCPRTVTSLKVSDLVSPRTPGSPGSFRVTALDRYGNRVAYSGTIHLTSSDASASLPPDYTFTAADAGTHVFSGIVLRTAGTQSLTATDTVRATLTGSQVGIAVR